MPLRFKTYRPVLLASVLGVMLGTAPGIGRFEVSESPVTVRRWQPRDFSFPAKLKKSENPFLVPFSATLKGPQGITLTLPGFYDGAGQWKIRAAPTVPGEWTIATQSTVPALSGRFAAFRCVPEANPRVHGPLRVDPAHPQHFVHEDGTHFYLQSYECDWLWGLELGRPVTGVTNRFLDKIARAGFNEVILCAVAHDTSWRPGTTGPDDYGPPKLNAWEGTRDSPEFKRFDLEYWRHFDEVIAALNARGMQAHVFIKVGNKKVNWPDPASPEDDLYFRWLISRYAAYPNITWDLTKEGYNLKDLDYKLNRLRFIRKTDAYHRLLTVHDDDKPTGAGRYDRLTDFLTDQQHDRYHETVLDQHARRNWPVLNAESCYEWGPGGAKDKTSDEAHSPEETALAAWDIAMAGGYATYYYTYTAWDVIRPQDTPPGYAYFENLGRFFRSTRYWTLQSADKLVDHGWCLADPGREYVVYQKEGRPFTLKVKGTARPLHATWFNPFTSKTAEAGTIPDGSVTFTPPAQWGSDPVVLHVSPQ